MGHILTETLKEQWSFGLLNKGFLHPRQKAGLSSWIPA